MGRVVTENGQQMNMERDDRIGIAWIKSGFLR